MKVVQILTPQFSNINQTNEIELGPNEKMTLIQVLIGKIENDFQILATLSEGAELNVYTALLARDTSKFEYNYRVEHLGSNSNSNFRLVSALSDSTQKKTTMQIHFAHGASDSVGSEKETVILSDHARNTSYPIILCDEENVTGSHSLSSGHINPLQLQYLQTRGFSEAQARDIITRAQMLDIFNLITDDTKLQYIYEALNES